MSEGRAVGHPWPTLRTPPTNRLLPDLCRACRRARAACGAPGALRARGRSGGLRRGLQRPGPCPGTAGGPSSCQSRPTSACGTWLVTKASDRPDPERFERLAIARSPDLTAQWGCHGATVSTPPCCGVGAFVRSRDPRTRDAGLSEGRHAPTRSRRQPNQSPALAVVHRPVRAAAPQQRVPSRVAELLERAYVALHDRVRGREGLDRARHTVLAQQVQRRPR